MEIFLYLKDCKQNIPKEVKICLGNYHKIKSSNTWKQNTKKPLQKIKNLLISL